MEEENEKKGLVWENIDCDESVDHLVGWVVNRERKLLERLGTWNLNVEANSCARDSELVACVPRSLFPSVHIRSSD